MGGARILVVDDDPPNAKLTRILLQDHGYDVRVARNAAEAQATLADWLPHLVLMDVQMPGMDGLTLTTLLRADPRTAGLIIVALTAYAMPGDREKSLDAGCDDYVAKPFDIRELPQLVAEWLERGREGS